MKVLEGNPGKRPLPKEPPVRRAPRGWRAPDHLHGQARETWDWLVGELQPIGVLATIDRLLLASLCTSWARYLEAELMLRREGRVLTTSNGNRVPNPWLTISRQEREQMTSLSARFGLTPSDRTKVGAPELPASPPEDGEPSSPAAPAGEFTGLIGQRKH